MAGTKSENLVPSTPVSMSETAGSLSNAMSRTGISYRLQDNRLSLSDGPIVIRDAAFGAVILENGRSRVICPQDEPIVESVVCETPLGRGLETVYSWTMPEGYGFKYKVTRVGSDRLTVAAEFVNGSLHPVYLQRFLLLDTPRGRFYRAGCRSRLDAGHDRCGGAPHGNARADASFGRCASGRKGF